MKGDEQKSPHRVFHSPACEFLDYYTTYFIYMQVFFEIFFGVEQTEALRYKSNTKAPFKDISATLMRH